MHSIIDVISVRSKNKGYRSFPAYQRERGELETSLAGARSSVHAMGQVTAQPERNEQGPNREIRKNKKLMQSMEAV